MLLKEKIAQYPFSNSELSIIQFILENPFELNEYTIKELAEKTYSSPSTFIRISHKLGYSGWNEFKDAYLEECKYLETHFKDVDANYPFKQNDTIMSIASKIAKLEQESIEDTLSLITHDDLQHALSIIRKSNLIHIFAVSNNIMLAEQFQHQMSRIQKDVVIHSLQSELVFNALLARKDSCAIILSYSGETDILIKCIKALQSNHIPTIAFTSIGENTIASQCDCILRICTREKLYSKIANYTVNTSISYLLDVIYSCIFAEHYEKNLKLKVESSKMIESGRFSEMNILKEDDNQFLY